MREMSFQNCKIKCIYYTTKYKNKTVKIRIYGNQRYNQVNSRQTNN